MKGARILVVAAVAGLAVEAWGQIQVNPGGANDANNRVGSGRLNTPSAPGMNPGINNNNIIYGNITGGRQFRGTIPFGDPREFRGNTVGTGVDRFTRDSAGAPAPNTVMVDPNLAVPFYGQSRAVPPPPGYVRAPGSGGYIPASLLAPPTNYIGQQPNDTRLGLISDTPAGSLAGTGGLLPGPLEAQNQSTTPLTGIRPVQPMEGTEGQEGSLLGSLKPLREQDNLQGLLTRPGETKPGEAKPGEAKPTEGRPGQQETEQPSSLVPPAALDQSREARQRRAMANEGMDDQVQTGRLGQTPTVEGSIRQRLLAPPPAQQSGQYAAMRKRLEKLYPDQQLTDEQAYRKFAAELRMRQEMAKSGQQPKTTQPAQKQPAVERQPGVQLPARGEEAGPVQVGSLAEGVKSPELAQRLRSAEELMKQGKFTSAIEQYQAARQLAGQNSYLPLLGQAHAELGGSFYTLAAQHLHQALSDDPTLVMGVYDLKAMIGAERLTKIIGDLKQIAADNPLDSRPMLLLAYIAYNSGNAKLAGQWLNEADQRSGGQDGVYRLLRKHWSLEEATPTTRPGMNK